MKREVLYGPLHLGGAAFSELYDQQQGIGQVTSFLRHWQAKSTIGTMLRILLSWTNYSLGISVSVLSDVTTNIPHMEAKWLSALRDYLNHVGAWIEVDDAEIAPLEREHDDYIMVLVLQSNEFQPTQIRMLNYCRLYLGAVTISDLTTTSGIYLDNAKLQGQISQMSSTTWWLKIYQERPADAQWKLWRRRANLLWSTREGRLHQPLGAWIRSNDERRIKCASYVHGHQLAIRVLDDYQVYDVDERSRQVSPRILDTIRYEDIHPEANPVEVYEARDGQWMARLPTKVRSCPSQHTDL